MIRRHSFILDTNGRGSERVSRLRAGGGARDDHRRGGGAGRRSAHAQPPALCAGGATGAGATPPHHAKGPRDTLYEQLRPIIDDVDGIEARLQEERAEPVGWLRVSVPPVIAADVLPALEALRREHPRLRIELHAEVRWADLHSDRIDVAVRAGRVGDPSLVQRRLGVRDVYAVASPAYLETHGEPDRLEALTDHALLRGLDPHGQPHTTWPTWSGGRVPVDGSFVSNDQRVLLEAALMGSGIALLSDVSAGHHVAAGRLRRVLAEHVGTALVLHAVFARRTLQPAAVRVCIDALVGWAAAGGPSRMRDG